MILLQPWEELILDILEVDLAIYQLYGTQVVVIRDRMKALRIIHESFGSQTIDEYLFINGHFSNAYSERYMCNYVE